MNDELRIKNRALLHSILQPILFLTVALLGGLRISAEQHAFLFVPPPLITLVLATLLCALIVKGRLISIEAWLSTAQPTRGLILNGLILLSLFFAAAQGFNSVLPEQGLLHWLFAFFFLWTLWNNQFSQLDVRRTIRSLAVLFGTAFILKHVLFSGFYSGEQSWLRRVAANLLDGMALNPDTAAYAPATGYISFFTVALFVGALAMLEPRPQTEYQNLIEAKPELSLPSDAMEKRRSAELSD
jgi:hypothetical protein